MYFYVSLKANAIFGALQTCTIPESFERLLFVEQINQSRASG